ncbi:23S rRNA (uridine(2552)-2'-O)-methyltransferase RlmE [Beggiatoa leptomitoformis]|uniref:Ribosomal RNA large subunit methyltransferase E n=1 Tax=Beggiatoa leptomitoformis TaxID=288004 RepID=A0A2N9YIG1_9GAMM|nr:23S rRNA (uridine(2552)-2'-O)-methyltransferase RlmE [Beggiatoa leptomitoformis]ALG67461.1 23S rRNA (uridine(2552)-2'-O)-methyltransferase RlmE [Beggiatoa leptomitoformis]AUI70322.1 23S rRNA (uridine(2552)-2'-O)-methyltransferase RlmE [Beggiatoa leptomitoformis]
MSRSKSSSTWLQEHHADMYVKRAQVEGYRSRAVYKLAQLDEKDKLFRHGMTVIDLGAAPGGWSQWLKLRFGDQVRVFALDILDMEPLSGVNFIQGDFREQSVLDALLVQLGDHKADLVMSDMSPNITGIKAVDQPSTMLLAELARDLALQVLAKNGHFLAKIFQGEGFDAFVKDLRQHFKQVVIRKPDASRARSPEIYVLAKCYTA